MNGAVEERTQKNKEKRREKGRTLQKEWEARK